MQTRRHLLRSIPAVTGLVTGCSTATRTEREERGSGSEGWTQFRGNTANTGCIPHGDGPSERPTVKWVHGTGNAVWSTPTVGDGMLYFGNYGGRLYALDTESGEEKWVFDTEGPIDGSAAFRDGIVYFGSFDRHLYAVDAQSGEMEWNYDTGAFVRSSPTLDDGTLYVGSGCSDAPECVLYARGEGIEAPAGGTVLALDSETGEIGWETPLDHPVISSPAVDDESVYVGGTDASLYAFDRETGAKQWEYGTGDIVISSPTLYDDSVYTGSYDGKIHAVDADTGDGEWVFDTEGIYVSGSTAVCHDTVYVGAPSNPNEGVDQSILFALSPETGDARWSVGFDAREIGSSPVVTDGTVYVGTHGGSNRGVHAVSGSGEKHWSFGLSSGEGVGSSPVVIGERLYFGADNGFLYALE